MSQWKNYFRTADVWLNRPELSLKAMGHIPHNVGYLLLLRKGNGRLHILNFNSSRQVLVEAMGRLRYSNAVQAIVSRADAQRLAIAQRDSPHGDYPRLLNELLGELPTYIESKPAAVADSSGAAPHWKGAVLVPVLY